MRFLRRLFLAALSWTLAGACAGSEFTSSASSGGTASGGQAGSGAAMGGSDTEHSGGAAGAGNGGAALGGTSAGASEAGSAGMSMAGGGGAPPERECKDYLDCNDADPCTIDSCSIEGSCEHHVKCAPGERCCDGACGQCCGDADCDDTLSCTEDTCVSGACMYTAKDALCAELQYCSPTEGCRAEAPCMKDSECDDRNPCTADRCVNTRCVRQGCGEGLNCCPGVGCAACCSNAQCDDDNACSRDTCQDGACVEAPHCQDGLVCCESADKASATCGACCAASDCDDHIACTVDLCTTTGCVNVPDATQCARDEVCNPRAGCERSERCDSPADCKSDDACLTADCVAGSCKFVGCALDQKCCEDGCSACCQDADCADELDCTVDRCDAGVCKNTPSNERCSPGFSCKPEDGGCVQCNVDGDCDDGNACTTDTCKQHRCSHGNACVGQGVCCGDRCAECCNNYDCVPPNPPTMSSTCTSYKCNAGKCEKKVQTCNSLDRCCPVGGCSVLGCLLSP